MSAVKTQKTLSKTPLRRVFSIPLYLYSREIQVIFAKASAGGASSECTTSLYLLARVTQRLLAKEPLLYCRLSDSENPRQGSSSRCFVQKNCTSQQLWGVKWRNLAKTMLCSHW